VHFLGNVINNFCYLKVTSWLLSLALQRHYSVPWKATYTGQHTTNTAGK